MSKGIRLYGVSKTNTSWGRVTAGVREGLEDIGALAGFVPVDDLVDDEAYQGADAPTAIFAGPPSMVAVMTSYGVHDQRYAILAPNSDWLPEKLIKEMLKFTDIVAPSTWGATIVERYTGVYVEPYLHGVSKGFQRDPNRPMRCSDLAGPFRVLHLASTWRQRKGTMELIEGWKQAHAAGELGPDPRLDIVVDAPEGTFDQAIGESTISFPLRAINCPTKAMCSLYQQYDLICQPSRAEGFGLIPLEARASGVPICATTCTGHAEHVFHGSPGVVGIASGHPAPVDDAPFGELSEAPSLDSSDVAEALGECYRQLPELARMAYDEAPNVAREWSWAAVTEKWLNKEQVAWT